MGAALGRTCAQLPVPWRPVQRHFLILFVDCSDEDHLSHVTKLFACQKASSRNICTLDDSATCQVLSSYVIGLDPGFGWAHIDRLEQDVLIGKWSRRPLWKMRRQTCFWQLARTCTHVSYCGFKPLAMIYSVRCSGPFSLGTVCLL